MEAAAHKPGHWTVGLLGGAAALTAMSVVAVAREPLGSAYALAWLAPLVLAVFSFLAYTRPLVTLILALVFITSPLRLAVTQPQSAVVSAFLLGACALGFACRTNWRRLARDPMIVPIGIFGGYGIVSAVHGLVAGNPLSYVIGDCFQAVEFAVVYFLVAQLLASAADIRLLLRSLLISMLIMVLAELVLFALGPLAGGLLPAWEGGAASEELLRTIDIDATILFTVLINLYPLARSPRQRYLLWAALIPTVANIALSLSRGLWVCTLAAGIASLALQGGKTRARLLKASTYVGVCVVLLAVGWKIGSGGGDSLMDVFEERIFHGVDQVEQGFAGTESMATRRFLEMAIVGPQVLERPWFGYGLGATYIIGGFAVLDSGTSGLIDHHFIHNLYLGTAFRMGLIGLGLLLWVLARYFRHIGKAYKRMPPDYSKAILAGLLASIFGQLFLSITEPTVVDHPTCALIATAMAVCFRLVPRMTQLDSSMDPTHGV
jgi:O-antigen ligase